jgi:CheY-like chemotaxis protein
MSHEIRTPLNGILGFVDVLSKDEDNIKRKEQFEHIKNSGSTLLAVINDILDLSKIENGKLSIENVCFITQDLFDSVANIYTEMCQNKDIDFIYAMSSNIPNSLCGDVVRIKQVLFNLLSNALKFTPEGGKIILDITYNSENNKLHCSVKDSGIGIEAENLTKIFNEFEQEDISTTRKYGGTGLGFSISYRLVEMMGGKLEVESIIDEGSEFFFEFEIHEGKDEVSSMLDAQAETSLHGHVLMVEDNKTNQALLAIFLDDFGISYDIANDGVEALSMFDKGTYDIILMDENMPNMNGIEATHQIRIIEEKQQLKHIPIIAVTANALSGERERFLSAGMDDYISKPYNAQDLRKSLQKYL